MRDGGTVRSRIQWAVALGGGWVSSHQGRGGGFLGCEGELRAHYKAPLMFAAAGRIAEASRCVAHIRGSLQNEEGELSSAGGGVKSEFSRFARNFANYMDGWVAIGAWMVGEYGFADQICSRLLETRSRSHGAIPTGPEKWVGRLRYDVLTNASIGRACLITGHRSEALELADFLTEVVAGRQPAPERELLMSFDDGWTPMEPRDPSERPYYRFVLAERGERVFCPAFACSFLCEAHSLSGKRAYLDAAESYLRFILSSEEERDGTLANGKSAWAAGSVALAKGDPDVASAARGMIGRVLERQSPKGEFGSRKRDADLPLAQRLETTAEQTAWCTQFLRMEAMGLWEDE